MAWGFLFGFIPVSWSVWIARTLADKAELAGGISVAVTQFSIGLVAAVGGLTFDDFGISGIFLIDRRDVSPRGRRPGQRQFYAVRQGQGAAPLKPKNTA